MGASGSRKSDWMSSSFHHILVEQKQEKDCGGYEAVLWIFAMRKEKGLVAKPLYWLETTRCDVH